MVNCLTPKIDWFLIYSFNITPESHVKGTRIQVNCYSPFQHLRICLWKSMENMHTDGRVLRVKCFLINLKVTNKQFKYVILLLFFCNTACSVILCAL